MFGSGNILPLVVLVLACTGSLARIVLSLKQLFEHLCHWFPRIGWYL